MLTDIGMKTKGLSVCWAGDIYYERKEYKKALECYLAGEGVYKLGEMYERGEGTTPDMEKRSNIMKKRKTVSTWDECTNRVMAQKRFVESIGLLPPLHRWSTYQLFRV